MDFDPVSGRRLLQAVESLGEQLEMFYQSLPSILERCAPDWTGDVAEHVAAVLEQYAEAKKKCCARLEGAEKRLRDAVETAEAIEGLFEKGRA